MTTNESKAADFQKLMTILTSPNASELIREHKEFIFNLIPELRKTDGFAQQNPWHLYDVFEHTLKVIENTEPNPYLRLAALFHDIGKPEVFFKDEKGIGHFYGHHKVSTQIFRKFALEFGLDQQTRFIVNELIYHHDGRLSTKRGKIKALIHELGPENIRLLFALKRADNLAQNPEKSMPVLEELKEIEEIYNSVIAEEIPSVNEQANLRK
jgi:tRNA nucleotidyltransferase (CCA-adding enzyme)